MAQIRYTISSSSFPVVVYLKDAEGNVIDTNTHYANEEGSFDADEGAYYILQFDPESEECGAILDIQTELIFCTTTTTTVELVGLYVIIYYYERYWQDGIIDGLRGYFTVDQPDDETVTLLIFPFTKVWNMGYYAGAGDYVIDGSDIQHWTNGSMDTPSFRYRINGGAWVSGLPTTVNVPSGLYFVEIEVSENSSFTTTTTTEITTTTTTVCVRPTPLDNYLVVHSIQFDGEADNNFYTGTYSDACDAWARFRGGDPITGLSIWMIETAEIALGSIVYADWEDTDCCGQPEGFVWLYPVAIDDTSENVGEYYPDMAAYFLTENCITIMENRGDVCGSVYHIESLTECCIPTTTTTTVVATTTTTCDGCTTTTTTECEGCTTTTTTEGATTTTTTCLDCTTTTTTIEVYSFLVKYANTPSGVCNAPVLTVYSNVPSPGAGDIIYINSSLSTPWNIPYPYLLFYPYDDLEWIISYEVPPPLGIFDQGELMWQQPYNCTTTTTTSAPGGDYKIEIVNVVNYFTKATVDKTNLASGTLYAMKIRLQNPDPGFSYNLLYQHAWTDLVVDNRYEVTWISSYYWNWDLSNGFPFYTIFDHDIDIGNPGFIKSQITDLPSTYSDEGLKWNWYIANNETGYIYLPFVIKPYGNLSGKKTIFVDFSKYTANTEIINPHWALQVNFSQDPKFRVYSGYICIEGSNTFYAYGIKDAVKAELYVYGGAVPLYTWEYDLDMMFYVDLEDYVSDLDTGYYIFKFYNDADTLLYTTAKIPVEPCTPEGVTNETVLLSIDRWEGGLQFLPGLQRVNRLYKFEPSTLDVKKLKWPPTDLDYIGAYIAASENMLYLAEECSQNDDDCSDNNYLHIYDMYQNPFEIYPTGVIEGFLTGVNGASLCMKDNSTIIAAYTTAYVNGILYEFDVSHLEPTYTFRNGKPVYGGMIQNEVWSLPSSLKFNGAIKKTTTDKLIFVAAGLTGAIKGKVVMCQADYGTGTIELMIDLVWYERGRYYASNIGSSHQILGIFFYDGYIWYVDSARRVYKITKECPYTITYVKELDVPQWQGGISQSFLYMTEHFTVTTTTTTTP